MNMILHNNPTALIVQGNTLADPKFKDGEAPKTFNYVVANPRRPVHSEMKRPPAWSGCQLHQLDPDVQ